MICDHLEKETLEVPPPEEGATSRKPRYLLPFVTYHS